MHTRTLVFGPMGNRHFHYLFVFLIFVPTSEELASLQQDDETSRGCFVHYVTCTCRSYFLFQTSYNIHLTSKFKSQITTTQQWITTPNLFTWYKHHIRQYIALHSISSVGSLGSSSRVTTRYTSCSAKKITNAFASSAGKPSRAVTGGEL